MAEMTEFHARYAAGEQSVKDLVRMGMGYTPGAAEKPVKWFGELVDYLRAKVERTPT
jgi:hypothetical protein